jgi:hypothetical protein
MFPRLTVPKQRQTAIKRILVCSEFACLSFVAIVGFGLLQKIQAAENTVPDHQVSAVPAKIQPKLMASYGKLPLSFEANQGQTDPRVRFLARGGGYTLFLTDDEAFLTFRKSSPVMSRLDKFGPRGRHDPFGPRAGRWPSLAGELQSLWPSLIPDLSQLVPNPYADMRALAAGPESQPEQVIRMRVVGGNPKGRVVGLDELPGKSNYFIGNDPKKWHTNVPSYAKVKYEGIYPGVDLVYYGNQRRLEYDFVVAPGADPNQIKLSFAGADGMRVDAASGDLVLKLGGDEVRLRKPAVYQPAVVAMSSSLSNSVAALSERPRRSESAATAELDGAFVQASNHQVAFRVAGYDPRQALVIDPVLTYSTLLGNGEAVGGAGIAIDSAGNAYVTGTVQAASFPIVNAFQPTMNGPADAFISKINPSGSALVYSTYLGGSDLNGANGIAIDSAGDAYVTGSTYATDFPTVNPLYTHVEGNNNNWSAFVSKLNATGSALIFSTYLGVYGWTYGNAIAVDSVGSVYVTGETYDYDFPTVNPVQANIAAGGAPDAFIIKLDYTGQIIDFSTFLGGNGEDAGTGITVDPNFQPYFTGVTNSTNFPANLTLGPIAKDPTGTHIFVGKMDFGGALVDFLTELGGSSGDFSTGIAVSPTCAGAPTICYDTYLTGYTNSVDFPTLNPIQPTCLSCGPDLGNNAAFVLQLNSANGGLIYSTYLTGGMGEQALGITLDSSLNAYVTGWTMSPDFPTVNPIQATCSSCSGNANGQGFPTDGFVTEVNAAGSALLFSTFLGGNNGDSGAGIAVDSSGDIFVTGGTESTNFPTYNPIQASTTQSAAFVTEISPGNGTPIASPSPTSLTFDPQNVGTNSTAQTVTVTNTGNGTLTISTVMIGGTNPGDFSTSADLCSGATVAPGGSCTLSVKFTPTASGTRSASLDFPDNASNSPQTVTLSGTGTGPVVSLSSPLTFSAQMVGTTSSSQAVTLTNTGNASLTFSAIAITAPFAIATSGTTCSTSTPVAAAGTCTVAVTFMPTAAGAATGSLSFSDNAPNSPQTLALSGTGSDFSFAPPSGSPTSTTVAPGATATYTLSVGGVGGFSGSVSFSCTGAPSEATCSVSPNPVTAGSTASNVTVTVTTTAPSLNAPRSGPLPPVLPLSPGLRGLLMLALALAAMAWAIHRRNQPGMNGWRCTTLRLAMGFLLLFALAGCGGGGGGGGTGPTQNPGTPAGTYNLTVTGTTGSGSSALSHNVALTLTVS